MESRFISIFYDKFVVETSKYDTVPDHCDPSKERLATYTSINHTDEYCLYVHGWSMEEWAKDRWAETMFKRLWWLGYRGKVGVFEWPTLVDKTTYDHSEFRAWRSGHALMELLKDLNQQYSGQVRVLAHSMGNVVMGEALHEAPEAYVNTYIATQAAVPAHLYDPTLPSRLVEDSAWSITTPDVYSHYPGTPEGTNYFAGFENKTTNKIINYFNQDDYALNFWWRNDEMTRPDLLLKPFYNYSEGKNGDNDINTYDPSEGDKFYTIDGLRTLKFPEDTFEIFSFCVQSRSWALGTIGKKEKIHNFGNHVDLETMGFDNTHYSHSKEFRSDLPDMLPYWEHVQHDFNLKVIKQGWDK